MNDNESQAVVLIHGLAGSRMVLIPLWLRLRKHYPDCFMWSYSSWKYDLRYHSDQLLGFAASHLANYQQVHFIVHSMGSIVLRAALAKYRIANLGRTVFLAPPHQGTPMADKFVNRWGERFQTVIDLKTGPNSFVNQLPSWSYGPACIIQAKGDFMIPPERTLLEGISQYAKVPGPHSYLLFSKKAAKLAIEFLETGKLPQQT